MERLWAPWRMEYIAGMDPGGSSGCIFCEAAEADEDEKRLIVHRAAHSMTIMNLFPYTNGHVMVVPYRHIAQITDLTDEERLELMRGATDAVAVMGEVLKCDGTNLGMNIGRAAGAGIDSHLHVHVVPRWIGDTNYMAVIDDTRVISEALTDTYNKLRSAYLARGIVADGGPSGRGT